MIFHGPEPTRSPDEYLGPSRIVIRGEPERHVLDVLQGSNPKGVSYWADDKAVHAEADPNMIPYDELPHPDRLPGRLVAFKTAYHNPKFRRGPFTTLMASRGCAHRCVFCVPNSISFARELDHVKAFGKKPLVSAASSGYVFDEFKMLAGQGFKSIMVVDDQFLWSKERTLAICDGVGPLKLDWGCLSRADSLLDQQVVKALALAGCRTIDIGVESLSQEVLDRVEKDLKAEDVARAVRNLVEFGIEPKINIMFGTCGLETPDTIRRTVETLRAMPVHNVMFSIATPFKGTRFHDACAASGALVDDSDQVDPIAMAKVSYPGLSAKELQDLNRWAYRRFYLRPGILFHRLRSLRSARDFFQDLRTAAKILWTAKR